MAPDNDDDRALGAVQDLTAELIVQARHIAAFELCRHVNRFAGALGARRIAIYLVDYSQRYVCSIGPEGEDDDIPVDGTIAGRAFTSAQRTLAHYDGEAGVWLPLLDGSERLGVMQVIHADGVDPDPRLDGFAAAVSEVIVSKNQYSDWFRRCRRRRDLTLSAEMQWRQLPPLTFTRPQFAIAGALEPAYDMGGDAFDYGDNLAGLRFSITDAMGHGTEAMVLSAAAMASLRRSRAHDVPLDETYRDVDELLRTHLGDNRFVTGIIAHFDPATGVLTWINAGHPPPILLRNRTVVGELACAPSLPMGLGGDVVEVARRQLQPGDRVLFYTDGVTEARHHDEQFGVERLIDYLLRTTLDGFDPAETMRRLSLAVLHHNDFELGDDSSMLMLEVRVVGESDTTD